jgi:glutamate racemase
VLGVVEPGARAAVAASITGVIAVIATEGTVRGEAYVRAIRALRPDALVLQRACPLFVPLAEEGWTDGAVPELAAERYLSEIFAATPTPDTLVLGCTHFPVLVRPIAKAVGPKVKLVDSAETTAVEVETLLDAGNQRNTARQQAPRFLSTDAPDRFARVGASFFGEPISPSQVELVDLAP